MDEANHRPRVALGPAPRRGGVAKPRLPAPAGPISSSELAPARPPGAKRVAPPALAPVRDAGEPTTAALAEWEGEGGRVLRPAPLAFARPPHRGVPQTGLP